MRRRVRFFQRIMIAVMIIVNVLFYLLRVEVSWINALTISVLSGLFIYFSLTFVALLARRKSERVFVEK
ncbi:MAG: hypothetical protein EP338_03805 [Bacteroidetes bacterium]|nr:MAG: hypothetical protein EP338_03805 [Bacteroidota bacterium]